MLIHLKVIGIIFGLVALTLAIGEWPSEALVIINAVVGPVLCILIYWLIYKLVKGD